jgi:hypothetical protein
MKTVDCVRIWSLCSCNSQKLICSASVIAFLLLSSFIALAQAGAEKSDPRELVRRTISNFKARELKARDYAYLERDFVFEKYWRGKSRHSRTYEVIPLGKALYRRQIQVNDQSLSPEEEKSEQQKLEDAIKRLDAQFDQRVAEPNANLANVQIPPGTPIAAIMFDRSFENWEMDIGSLAGGFVFHLGGEEVSDGRKVRIVEGDPTEKPGWAVRGLLSIHNFRIKMWIDEAEEQLVKLEARAINKGLLARAEYAKVNPSEFNRAAAKAELNSLYESALWYQRGMVITREWKKVSPEVWLPASLHVKGKKSHERQYTNGDHGSATWEMEQETKYWNYQKFTVTHRLLPHLPDVQSVPEAQPATADRVPKADH